MLSSSRARFLSNHFQHMSMRSQRALFKNGSLWYVTTTDRGSNEVAARNVVQSYVGMHLGLAPVFYANSDCFEHLGHLITLGSMKSIDEDLLNIRQWKYYSSLAVFCNTVRGVAKKCTTNGQLSMATCRPAKL